MKQAPEILGTAPSTLFIPSSLHPHLPIASASLMRRRGDEHPIYRHYHLASFGFSSLAKKKLAAAVPSFVKMFTSTVSLDTHLALVALHQGIIISVCW